MNHIKISLSLILHGAFVSLSALEVGRYDNGEYYHRIPGDASRKMFPYIVRSDSGPATDYELEQDDICPQSTSMSELRSMFSSLDQSVKNGKLIYFDSASTAQMPDMVIQAITDYYQHYKSNVGRGLYDFAELATKTFEISRSKVARFIHAQRKEIIFTTGTTGSINTVVHIWAEHAIKPGEEIIISEVEHNANFIPWQQLAKRTGIILTRVPLNNKGLLDPSVLQQYVSEKTKLVAVTHQSNILGTVNDVKAITEVAHSVGARVLIDAAQSVAHQEIDVQSIGCDFLAFSGHKLFGSTGIGVLFMKEQLFSECVLHNFGGGMAYEVTPEYVNFKDIPYCLEPGTQAIAEVIGLGAAIDFMRTYVDFHHVQEHETRLVKRCAQAIASMPEFTLISPIPDHNEHANMVTFIPEHMHAYDVAEYLNEHGIAVRAGYHCAQPYHDAHANGNASVRISIAMYNTEEEIDFLIDCLKNIPQPKH